MEKGQEKRVVLVNPPDGGFKKVDKDKAGGLGTVNFYETAPNPPLDLLRTAAVLEEEGHYISILESVIEKLDDEAAIDRLASEKADYIGVRLSLPSLDKDLRFVNRLKQRLNANKTFAFGNVIKDTYQRWFLNNAADYLIFGEPEAVIKDFILDQKIDNIEGLVWKENSRIVNSSPWRYLDNLDDLPPPAWHLLPLWKYIRSKRVEDFNFFLWTSEGCPYRCRMCPYLATQGNKWRARGPEKVMSELKYLKERFGARRIETRDACLDVDKKRVVTICNLIIESGLKFDFTVELNLENLDQDLILALARAGTSTLMTGIESMSELDLAEIGQRSGSLEKIKRNVAVCRKYRIKVIGFFMLGFPRDSWRSISLMIKRAKKLSLDLYDFTILTPYFGTALYEEALAQGNIDRDISYADFDSCTAILKTKYLDRPELNFARVYAVKVLAVFNLRRKIKRAVLDRDFNYLAKNYRKLISDHVILLYLKIKILGFKIRRFLSLRA